jgi:hypothetical protein
LPAKVKPLSRTIFTIAVAALGAAIFLTPLPAPGAEENFFQKFTPTDPCNWAGFYIGFNNGATFTHVDVGKHATDVDLTRSATKSCAKFVACKAPPRSFCANASLATPV